MSECEGEEGQRCKPYGRIDDDNLALRERYNITVDAPFQLRSERYEASGLVPAAEFK